MHNELLHLIFVLHFIILAFKLHSLQYYLPAPSWAPNFSLTIPCSVKNHPVENPFSCYFTRSTLQINLSSEIASSQLQTRLTKINELARCSANALRWEWEWQTGEASERPVGQEEKVRGRSEGWGLEWSQFTLELLTLRATTQRSHGLLKSFKPSGSQGVQGCPQGTLGKSGDNFVF